MSNTVDFADKELYIDRPEIPITKKLTWENVNELKNKHNLDTDRITLLENGSVNKSNALIEYGFNWVADFDWYVFAQSYYFDGVFYNNFVSQTITIDAAPVTVDFKRFDVIVFNNDFTFSVIKGIEGLNPSVPKYDISTQLYVTTILVQYGETSPTGINRDVVYKEGDGLPNEFTATKNLQGQDAVDLFSEENPETGIISIKVNYADADTEIFLDKGEYLTASDYDTLLMSIFNSDVRDNRIYVYLYNSIDEYYTSTVQVLDGVFGYSKNNTTSYQKINIPFSSFGVTDSDKFTGIAIQFKGSINSRLFIDNVELQGGFTEPVVDPLSLLVPYAGATSDVDLGDNKIEAVRLVANGTTDSNAGVSVKMYNEINTFTSYLDYLTISATSDSKITFSGKTDVSQLKGFIFNYSLISNLRHREFILPNADGTIALKDKAYTVATLPAGTIGDTAYVTDATAPTYLGTLTGGGSVVCPVFYNGTAWVSH